MNNDREGGMVDVCGSQREGEALTKLHRAGQSSG